jgi:hypothetical protein
MKRRSFLSATGALVVSFRWPADAVAQGPLPGSLAKQPLIDGWVRIGTDGRVTVLTGKVELGQGIKTALLQLAAEELVIAPERVSLVTADTERTADEGYTAGSHSMQDSGTAIRHAAAQARTILIGLAATRLALPVAQLSVENGVVRGGGQSVRYEELLTAGQVLHVKAAPQASLRDPARHTVAGKPLPRIDIPAKLSGGAAYVQDIRLDGMVHGRVVRPPSPGASLTQVDAAAVERMPGVLKVVRDGRFLAVIAQREYQAVTAMRALEKAAQWSEQATLEDVEPVYDAVRRAGSRSGCWHQRRQRDLPSALHAAWVDRAIVCGGPPRRRQDHGVDALAGRVPAAQGTGRDAGRARGKRALHSRRGLGLLWTQRR